MARLIDDFLPAAAVAPEARGIAIERLARLPGPRYLRAIAATAWENATKERLDLWEFELIVGGIPRDPDAA